MDTRYLQRPGGRVAYDDTGGEGPVVVCVPGLGDTRAEYRHLRPLLVAAGCRVVTLDLRGHGESSVGWPSHGPEDVGDDVVALLEHLGIGAGGPGAVVYGCSYGAASAVWAAAARPDVVRGIALAGPFVRDLPTPWYVRAAVPLLTAGAWAKVVAGVYVTDRHGDRGEHLRSLRTNLKEPGRIAAVKAMIRASKTPCEERLGDVSAAAVVLMGSEDSDFPDPEAEARHVADALGGSHVLLDGLGHYPHAEDAATTAPHVIDLVERTCRASA